VLLGTLIVVLAGCGSTSSQATVESLPTMTAILPTATTAPTAASERVWKKQAVGASNVTITFYSGPGGSACIRIQLDAAASAPVEKCAVSGTLVAIQGTTTDSAGKLYTIVAGRCLANQITAVSLEMASGDNTPAEVEDGGFVITLPVKKKAVRAVPIDQYGNLVGQIYAFG